MEQYLPEAFSEASREHFEWQTRGGLVAQRERELVRAAFEPLGERVLDLGCGEGATLFHLGGPSGAHGVDLFDAKVEFARRELPQCHFRQASVYELPFSDASFDHLLVRDLIHHLDHPERFIEQCARVCAVGGRLDVLEPCRYNPLIALHGLTNRVERGELRSTVPFLSELIGPKFRLERVERYQALPLHRIVFHPALGWPRLAHSGVLSSLVSGAERLCEHLIPPACWAYVHLRAVRAP